jgi:hypothetical protein
MCSVTDLSYEEALALPEPKSIWLHGSSGKVRGILCNECNRGLGYFHDNKEALMNAAKYLAEEDQTSEGGTCSCLL